MSGHKWHIGLAVAAASVICSPAMAIIVGTTNPFDTTGTWGVTNFTFSNVPVYNWGTGPGSGTAVAVSPYYLLTARHVAGAASSIVIGGVTYNVTGIITPPPDPGQTNAPDLALIKLDKPLPSYVPLYSGTLTTGYSGQLTSSNKIIMVGAGITGTSNGSSYTFGVDTPANQIKRWGTSIISNIPSMATTIGSATSTEFFMGYNTFTVNGQPTPYYAGAGNHDSGSASFVIVNGALQLAGINNGVSGTGVAGQYNGTWAVSIPAYYNWITANDIPEPATLALLAAGGAGLLLRRRGRAKA